MTTLTAHRRRYRLRGVVQGVGFRPFVYRLAHELELTGFVTNDAGGVTVEVQGTEEHLTRFGHRLRREVPPHARIDRCDVQPLAQGPETTFSIRESDRGGTATALVPPDIAVCADCLRELFDPGDRRYLYPFINCTNCGPRYTIVARIPYDRPYTSMSSFRLCPDCEREYHDPTDRRFHAQPVACPACGPRLSLHDGRQPVACDDVVAVAAEAIRNGQIVALRGLGGFHLVVDAMQEDAVRRLRRRKLRAEKPLAVMAPDTGVIRRFCHVDRQEEELLRSSAAPIVLLRRRSVADPIAPSVAFANRYYGFMLPYTPLHHLLLREGFEALVMTSGNLSEEPIVTGNSEALARLAGIADLFVLHDREILQRCDDSIVRVSGGRGRQIRRARGWVPDPIYLAQPVPRPLLAVGGELKNTIALARDDQVIFSQHIGDLDNPAALDFFTECMAHLRQVLEIEPEAIACDLHPEYLSTKWAHAQNELPVIPVQHHHAHLAAVLTEHGSTGPTIGIILDGTGYGADGTIWGGEVLIGDASAYERFAWLEPVPMPGGAAAVREPWRMASSYLHYARGADPARLNPSIDLAPGQRRTLRRMIEKGINSPLTSSAGRLFDGVAALLGLCRENRYEAQAAIALEMAALAAPEASREGRPRKVARGPIPFANLIRAAAEADDPREAARQFHVDLAELFCGAARAARDETGIRQVALSGGVFQNVLFFEYMVRRLTEEGCEVLTHALVPTNDGGLALGQIAVAAAHLRRLPGGAR